MKVRNTGIRADATFRDSYYIPSYMPNAGDYVPGLLSFSIYPHEEHLSHNITLPGMIQSARADSPEPIYLNLILRESYELSFDTDITFKGKHIPAGTNLLKQGLLDERVRIDPDEKAYDRSRPQYVLILLENDLVRDIGFESTEFVATVKCKTDDGLDFSASCDVSIEMNPDITPPL